MKAKEVIEKASIKVGGLSELARILRWNKGTIAQIKKAGKLSPYRAGQLAEVLGTDVVAAYLEAHIELSLTDHEKDFWEEQLKERKKKLKFA
jgi:plasmid maintenance system antidote protein VapI